MLMPTNLTPFLPIVVLTTRINEPFRMVLPILFRVNRPIATPEIKIVPILLNLYSLLYSKLATLSIATRATAREAFR
jgi:hypothetical protein